MENKTELELNLVDLFFYLKKKIIIIVAVVVIAALLGFLGSLLFLTPEYTASTRIYVLNRTSDSSVVYADIQISSQLLNDYKVLITGRNVTQTVINQLGLDMTPAKLANSITVTAPESTRVIQIGVVDTDPARAALIANTVREVASAEIQRIMDVDAVKLVYEADVPTAPSSASASRNALILAVIGLVGAIGVLVMIYIWDDTIQTEDDVEPFLGISTFGVIPISAELGTLQKKKASRLNRIISRFIPKK